MLIHDFDYGLNDAKTLFKYLSPICACYIGLDSKQMLTIVYYGKETTLLVGKGVTLSVVFLFLYICEILVCVLF